VLDILVLFQIAPHAQTAVKGLVRQQEENIDMSHFSQLNLCCFSSDSCVPHPLSHSVSHWVSLPASALHKYLASSRAHIYLTLQPVQLCSQALTFHCLILISKRDLTKESIFYLLLCQHRYKNIHLCLKIARDTPDILEAYAVVNMMMLLSFSSRFHPNLSPHFAHFSVFFPFFFFFFFFFFFARLFRLSTPLSDVIKVSVTPADERGRRGKRAFVRANEKGKGTADRKHQRLGECEMSGRKTSRGSEGLICVLTPFLTLSSELSCGSGEVRGDECFHYITIIWSSSKVALFLFYSLSSPWFIRLPRFLHCPSLPFHFSWLTDVTHRGPLISPSLTHTHTHTHREFTPISTNCTCSLCWLIHISFYLHLIWTENCHLLRDNVSTANNRSDFLRGFVEQGQWRSQNLLRISRNRNKISTGTKELLSLCPWSRCLL